LTNLRLLVQKILILRSAWLRSIDLFLDGDVSLAIGSDFNR